jgi:hypothetical protein
VLLTSIVTGVTNVPLLERTFDWSLDHDGDLCGDERERPRWYEAITATASIRWVFLPWVAFVCLLAVCLLAVCLLSGGRPVLPAVAGMRRRLRRQQVDQSDPVDVE